MGFVVAVENIKCGGCASSIRKGLLENPLVEAVEVDVGSGQVHVQAEGSARAEIVQKLARLGYPEVGSVEGMQAAAAKAKSFVSCAIGRIENAGKE